MQRLPALHFSYSMVIHTPSPLTLASSIRLNTTINGALLQEAFKASNQKVPSA